MSNNWFLGDQRWHWQRYELRALVVRPWEQAAEVGDRTLGKSGQVSFDSTNNLANQPRLLSNHQNVNQEEETEDGEEGEVPKGHQHTLEVVPVGHCPSLIFGSCWNFGRGWREIDF